jgi:predicted RND superfamily exporter protein
MEATKTIALEPSRFEKLVVKFPCACCWAWFGFGMAWTMMAVGFMASGQLSFDARGVWDVRSHPVQKQFDAFMLARSDIKMNESTLSQYDERSQAMLPLHVLYFSEDGDDNFLDAKHLAWMKGVEAKLGSSTAFESKCVMQQGIDSAQSPIGFASLDWSTNTITADSTPANGTAIVFSGTSSALMDGGRYIVRLTGVANQFKLMLRNAQLVDIEVAFSSTSIISVGARFLPAAPKCSAADSVLNFAYPAAAEQKQSMCSGFVPMQSVNGVPVLTKICGCDATSAVNDAILPCEHDCGSNFGTSPSCASTAYVAPGAAIVNANLAKLCPNAPGLTASERMQYQSARQAVIAKGWDCSAAGAVSSSNMVRSTFKFGGPVEGYTRITGDTVSDQTKKMTSWAKDSFYSEVQGISSDANADAEGTARVYIISPFMIQMAFDSLMSSDGMLAMGSIWFVWMWTWCTTGSLLLASGCIFEVFVSLPMAMATWAMFGQQWLGFLTIMMIFVILGIGADDVFVLVDAWKQSGQQGFGDDLQTRFSWAYRRARNSMLVTTMTTFSGFFAAGLSDVPSISGFGFFAALVVFWDYIMCITFFASLTVVYHKYFEQKNVCCFGNLTGHMGCCPIPCLGLDDPKPTWKKPRIMVPFVSLFLLGFILIFFLPIIGCLLMCGAMIFGNSLLSSAQTDMASARPVEKFFKEKYFPVVVRHRIKFVSCVALIFCASAAVVGALLRLPTKEEPFLSKNHPLQRYLDSSADFGNSGSVPLTWVYVVFGIDKEDALDRSGVDYQQPGTGWSQNNPEEPLGKVQYVSAARQAMVSTAGQTEILGLCDSIRAAPVVARYDSDCEWVVYNGVGYQGLVPNKASLVSSGHLKVLAASSSMPYLEAQNSVTSLPDISTGFCSTGVYCFMYSVRDYLVSFCDPTSGLKAKWIQAGGSAFSSLCIDANGNTISGGASAFPAADLDAIVSSEGFRIYEETVVRRDRLQNGMAYDEFQRSMMTNKVVSGGQLQFAFIGINGTIPMDEFPYSEQQKLYDAFVSFFESRLVVNSKAYFSAFIFNWMFITEALIRNTVQSVVLGIVFCFMVALVLTWNVLVSAFVVSAVTIIVTVAVGFICVMGWTLGIIEAIVLIVIVGISVDYSVHIAHSYNHATESADLVEAQIREEKCLQAVGSLGISLLSGLATSMGAAIFLWFCQVSFFRKFGQFLIMTLAISFSVTFCYLIPVLLCVGPVKGRGFLPTISRFWAKSADDAAAEQVKVHPASYKVDAAAEQQGGSSAEGGGTETVKEESFYA